MFFNAFCVPQLHVFGGGPAPIPNSANCLAMYQRTGPFWQDTARTIPATVPGQDVKAWDDISGNGKHLIWKTGAAVPVLRSGGGVVCAVGARMDAPVTTGGSNNWTVYQTALDTNTADSGWAFCEGSHAGTPLTGFGPAYSGEGSLAGGIAGLYTVSGGADPGALACRGMAATSGSATFFTDSLETLAGSLGTASLSIVTFCNDGAFSFVGEIVNGAVYLGTDDATARSAVRAYLAVY